MRYLPLWIITFLFLGIFSFSFYNNGSNNALAQSNEDPAGKPKPNPTTPRCTTCDGGARPGTLRCVGDDRERCEAPSCTWKPYPCPAGEVCKDDSKCSKPPPPSPTPCTCDGQPEGTKRCSGTYEREICQKIVNDCDWRPLLPSCLNAQTCENGECVDCKCGDSPKGTTRCNGNILETCLPQDPGLTCTFQPTRDCAKYGEECTSIGGTPRCKPTPCTRCNAFNINIGESTCNGNKTKTVTCVHPHLEDGTEDKSKCKEEFTDCISPEICVEISNTQAACQRPTPRPTKPCSPDGDGIYSKCDPDDPTIRLICKWPDGYVIKEPCTPQGTVCSINPGAEQSAVCLPPP